MFNFCQNCLKSDCVTSLAGFEQLLIFLFLLALSVPEKLKNSFSEIPIIPQTLNINNQRTTSESLSLLDTLYNMFFVKAMCTLTFSRYCCSKVDQYYDLHSRSQGAKGLEFRRKTKNIFSFRWICLKHDCLTSLEDFEWFLFF